METQSPLKLGLWRHSQTKVYVTRCIQVTKATMGTPGVRTLTNQDPSNPSQRVKITTRVWLINSVTPRALQRVDKLKEIRWDIVDWIHPAQGRNEWLAFIKRVIKSRVFIEWLSACRLQKGFCFTELLFRINPSACNMPSSSTLQFAVLAVVTVQLMFCWLWHASSAFAC